jgi:ribosome-associated protein
VRVAHRLATELFAKKAEDVVLMDLRNLSTVADYYLIATCRNEPQMRAILGGIQRALSREGVRSLRSEYMPGVRWAVVDFGDIILHLFEKQTRGFYSLERLWADAPSTTLRAEDYVSEDAAADEDDAGRTSAHDDL